MTIHYKKIIQVILIGISVCMLGWLLWEKMQLGLIRYFDADEMAYLHWSHSVYRGQIPYRDFLSYVPPVFYYALTPLYWCIHNADILFAGRVFAFVVFVGLTSSIAYLFWLVRKSWIAICAGILLAFIPIPADKFIEIRPDNLAIFVALLGSIFHSMAFTNSNRRMYWFVSGVLYMSALLVLPKVVPQVMAAILVTACWLVWGEPARRERMQMVGVFIAGLIASLFLFGIWIVSVSSSVSQIEMIWYSLIKLPLEVNKIGELFPMQPYQFFYPNTLLYGASGWALSLFLNHGIWMLGLLIGTIRLVTPFLPNGKKGVWTELLIGFSFMGYVALFMYGYPMRHEQYLIPIGIYIAFYAADSLFVLWTKMNDHALPLTAFAFGFGSLLFILFHVSIDMNREKYVYTNKSDYKTLQNILQAIPPNTYIFDLVGSTIYFPDPYYVSAVPFGQWEPYLSRPLPVVREALEKTSTQYIYEGGLGRINTLSEDTRVYIQSVFHPVSGIPGLWMKKIK